MAKQKAGTTTFTISYEDGTEATHKVKPRHLIAFEDEVGFGEDARIGDSFKLAHMASESSLPFAEWIKTVDDIETETPDAPIPQAAIAVDGGEAQAVPTE